MLIGISSAPDGGQRRPTLRPGKRRHRAGPERRERRCRLGRRRVPLCVPLWRDGAGAPGPGEEGGRAGGRAPGGQEAIQENARLRELLGLRSKRQDLTFESAKVTARSASNWQSTLTLSKGREAGLQPGNCVITSTGVLVGVVSEVGSHTATVSTVIDTSMEMGGIITRNQQRRCAGGDFALMKEGRLKLSYLPDGAQLVAGDEVLTSGKGDVYPSGLVVGQVEGVFSDASGMNRYAVVAPEVALDTLVEVFVIKDFDIVE